VTTFSQPVRLPVTTTEEKTSMENSLEANEADGSEKAAKETEAVDSLWGCITRGSFTQPVKFEELIVGTQVPCTPGASQVLYLQKYNRNRDSPHMAQSS